MSDKEMKLRDTLTKENFWNATMEQFPKSTKLFCDWIDEYKIDVRWDSLFNASGEDARYISPKFHDLPYDMQVGIWICFVTDTLDSFFEQPEYEYSFDLAEDIKTVFGQIEELID